MNGLPCLLEGQIPPLRRYAHALVRNGASADDLVQVTLMRALAKRHLWKPETDLRAWLFTIMHNEHVNVLRRRLRERSLLSEADPCPSVSARQHGELQLRDLRKALDQMPDEQRSAVLLIGLEGMTYAEVASILSLPIGTIRSRLSRAREALREIIDDPRLRGSRRPSRQSRATPAA